MTRKLRIGARGLVLFGMALAVAVLVLPHGRGQVAAQPPPMHYKCYMPTVPGDPPGTVVNLETQFGVEELVTVGPAMELCAPALKNGIGPPLDGPHLRCYDIVGDDPDAAVQLEDQFGTQTVAVGQAQKLCVPVTKAVYPDPPPPPLPTDPHYKCYAISGHDPDATVDLQTQFGPEPGVVVGKAVLLCAPTVKTVVSGPGEPGGGLDDPHLVCYTISPPPTTIPLLNTLTQFDAGVPKEVEPAGADLLCVEAAKSPAVGGIQELPAPAGAEASGVAGEGSGWPVGAYAGLAAGLAAAVVALGGGAWYARRRLLR